MSTYDVPSRHIYCFDAVNLAAAFSRNIRGPKGKRGRVLSAAFQVTTSVAGATSLPIATVTTTASPIPNSPKAPVPSASTIVMNFTVPATTAPAGVTSDAVPAAVVRDTNNFIQIVPADFDLVFAIAPASGAGAAGIADVELNIDWF